MLECVSFPIGLNCWGSLFSDLWCLQRKETLQRFCSITKMISLATGIRYNLIILITPLVKGHLTKNSGSCSLNGTLLQNLGSSEIVYKHSLRAENFNTIIFSKFMYIWRNLCIGPLLWATVLVFNMTFHQDIVFPLKFLYLFHLYEYTFDFLSRLFKNHLLQASI